MPKRTVKFLLQDIFECIERIEKYIDNLDKEKFIKNEMASDAVIRNLEIIGEAAKNVPQEVKDKADQIPWKKVIGFRNIIVHEYFFVDLHNVWFIVKEQLPKLKTEIQQLLKTI